MSLNWPNHTHYASFRLLSLHAAQLITLWDGTAFKCWIVRLVVLVILAIESRQWVAFEIFCHLHIGFGNLGHLGFGS